jgi:molecular chaperone GrpE
MTIPRDPPDFLADEPATDRAHPPHEESVPLPMEPDASAISRLEQEVADVRDRHVRLAAEFDNYRKRSARERGEIADRAQATLVGRLLDALDDLHRAVTSDPASTPADALRTAINAVDQKVWKEVQAAGLERIDPIGAPFDPTLHEAVSIVPASAPEQEQTVAATFQVGYRFRGVLVRPARVAVYSTQGAA